MAVKRIEFNLDENDINNQKEEWLSWRRTHITATDASILCGKSRFVKSGEEKLSIYNEKIHHVQKEDNIYMARGRALEPLAREYLSKKFGVDLSSACFENEDLPVFGASIDAISDDNMVAYEIKTTGDKKLMDLIGGLPVEEGYIYQVQAQMLVLGLDRIGVFYYADDDKNHLIMIQRDETIINEIIEKGMEFWRENIIPEKSPKFVNAHFAHLVERYQETKMQIENLNKELGYIKDEMIETTNGVPVNAYGVSLRKSKGRASIRYSAMIKDMKIDIDRETLEKYSSVGKESWSVVVEKKDNEL